MGEAWAGAESIRRRCIRSSARGRLLTLSVSGRVGRGSPSRRGWRARLCIARDRRLAAGSAGTFDPVLTTANLTDHKNEPSETDPHDWPPDADVLAQLARVLRVPRRSSSASILTPRLRAFPLL